MARERLWCRCAAALIPVLVAVLCSTSAPAAERSKGARKTTTPRVKYVPPKRGAPKVRVSAASRGGDEELPSLYVLAPDHVGVTVEAKPTLFWFQSKTTTLPIRFSLAEHDAIDPLLEFTFRGPRLAGRVPVSLADFGVRLDRGVEYRWTVAIRPDPGKPSKDIFAEGRIVRLAPSEKLARELKGAAEEARAAVFASHGVWYDALLALDDQVRVRPDDAHWRRWRAELLRDAGLAEPAAALAKGPVPRQAPSGTGSQRPKKAQGPAKIRPLRYVPPSRGAPSRIVTTATRHGDRTRPSPAPQATDGPRVPTKVLARTAAGPGASIVTVLAPKQGGRTLSEEPSLFWWLSRPPGVPIHLRIIDRDTVEPLWEAFVRRSDCRGICRLELASFGAVLAPDKDYNWLITMAPEWDDRAKDVTVGTLVRRVSAPAQVRDDLARAKPGDRPAVLARHGFWYDALAALADVVDSEPANTARRGQVASLLKQVGLEDAAEALLARD